MYAFLQRCPYNFFNWTISKQVVYVLAPSLNHSAQKPKKNIPSYTTIITSKKINYSSSKICYPVQIIFTYLYIQCLYSSWPSSSLETNQVCPTLPAPWSPLTWTRLCTLFLLTPSIGWRWASYLLSLALLCSPINWRREWRPWSCLREALGKSAPQVLLHLMDLSRRQVLSCS